ncbi:MAG: Gfo/Idh/MocA family oxidoreductase [Planctomycetaceae bacterium]|jgi:predicted dehydrogenase|nr:Gfo/Idh/MocA family oxidoreductase [Planctomycetaceae bacterium]
MILENSVKNAVKKSVTTNRRQFLKNAVALSAVAAVPFYISGKVLGKDGAVPPSEQIILGALGIGSRGGGDFSVFLKNPDVRFLSICDIRKSRREWVKQQADAKYGSNDCTMFRNMFEFYDANPQMDAVLIATGDRWHTMATIVAAKAGKDVYCEKPLSLTIQESRAVEKAVNRYGRVFQAGTQRRNIGNFQLAAKLAHEGKLGKLTEVHANTLSPGTTHDWLPAQPEPPRDEVDWELWLGPCPWRPYNESYVRGGWRGFYDFHGGGILEWGTHTVDLCQWANQSDDTVPVEYWATYNEKSEKTARVEARYANGVKLVCRNDGWLGLGTCSARYVGEEGWVETGDSGRMEVSSDALRKELKYFGMPGTSPDNHIREFLDCVKSRKKPASNADVAANAHIASHCAKIAWDLNPAQLSDSEKSFTLKFDPVKEEFTGNGSEVETANRLRSRAMRSPWRC